MTTEITDNASQSRYEIHVDGALAGFAVYELRSGGITFTHTEVGDEFEGQGVGSKLVAGALDGARRGGLLVTPLCPFVASYIERHPEYVDIVDPTADAR
jgi:predicted GNAT family acetyltransferase